MLNIAKGND